jgi:hypothetical protein
MSMNQPPPTTMYSCCNFPCVFFFLLAVCFTFYVFARQDAQAFQSAVNTIPPVFHPLSILDFFSDTFCLNQFLLHRSGLTPLSARRASPSRPTTLLPPRPLAKGGTPPCSCPDQILTTMVASRSRGCTPRVRRFIALHPGIVKFIKSRQKQTKHVFSVFKF